MKDSSNVPLSALLSKYHNKKFQACRVKNKPINLHGGASSERSTVLVEIVIDSVGFSSFPLDGRSKGKHEVQSRSVKPKSPLALTRGNFLHNFHSC